MGVKEFGTPAPHGTRALQRVSWLARTVRYETRYRDRQGNVVCVAYEPIFDATLQEWERARD